MGDDLDIGVVKKTQETLGKVVKKPPLTDKLLRKPPFRFLHDIMTAVINTTGFMKGLYTADEMNSDAVKDKEKKIAFLQKAIDVVVLATGKSLSVKPSKIVAGLEAEKTNEFLQALGKAILNKVDSAKAVATVLTKGSSSASHKTVKSEVEVDDKKPELTNGHHSKSKKEHKEKSDKKSAKENVEKVRPHRGDADGEKVSSGDTKKEKHKPSVKPSPEKVPRSKDSPKNVTNSSSANRDQSKSSPKITESSSRKSGTREKSPTKSSKVSLDSSPRKRVSKESPDRRQSSKESPEKRSVKESPKREHSGTVVRKSERSADGSKRVNENANSTKVQVEKAVADEPVALLSSNDMQNGDGGENEVEIQESGKIIGRPPTGRPGTAKLSKPMALSDGLSQEVGPQGVGGDVLETKDEPVVDRAEDSVPRPATSLRRRSARPPSARPAAPRVKSVDTGDEQQMLELRNQVVPNIIVDNGNAPEEEDDNFVVAESSVQPEDYPRPTVAALSRGTSPQVGQGSLVTQILETKKDLEGDIQRGNKVEIDKSELSDAGKFKQRERTAQEVERLRECVQNLARGANPLGKRLDYLQEDLDMMQRELDTWTKESKYFIQALKSEESKSDSEVERLKGQLKEADDAMSDQQARIFAVKSNILRQDARIRKMIVAAKL